LVFFRMAVSNVGRNWNRTGMIILSMMVASALMTLTLALATGYPDTAQLSYRRMVGADILVYPNRFVFGGPSGQPEAWELRRLSPDQPTDVLFFHPDFASGYLSPAGAPPPYFDLENLPAALLEPAGVSRIEPGRLLRAYLVSEEAGRVTRIPVTLRGRDIEADLAQWRIPETMVRGRYFRETHDQDLVALVNGRGLSVPVSPGERLVLEIPAIRGHSEAGAPIVDHADRRSYYFLTYGVFELPLGQVPLLGLEDEESPVRVHVAVGIDEPEVWIPAGTFDRLYEEISGAPPRYTGQFGLTAENMFRAKEVAAALAEALPDCTVLTVPQEVSLAGMSYEARFDRDTHRVGIRRIYNSKASVSLDIRGRLAGLAFIVAGLLVVANMYILVTQRRREIGVLKAIGASSRDIFVLILTESLGYSVVGSLIGFVFVRLMTLLSLFASSVSLVEGALLSLQAGGLVMGLTVGTSLVFGFLPAWDAAKTPTASLVKDS
jgi:hypothetical protein